MDHSSAVPPLADVLPAGDVPVGNAPVGNGPVGMAPPRVVPDDMALPDDRSVARADDEEAAERAARATGLLPPPPLARGQVLLRTLGMAEVHVGGVGVITPAAERMFSLLVLGAMAPDHALAREDVLTLVWPDTDRGNARHSLRQHLYKLRGWGVPIHATRATVTLSRACLVPCFALDRTAALFDSDVLRGGEPFGHLFAGWHPSIPAMRRWVEDQRDRFQMDVRRILIPELRRLRDRADWLECERWARTVLEFDPYNEDGMLVLAEAIAMQGSRHSARTMLDGYVRETGMAGTDLAQDLEAAQRRIGRATRVRHEAAATPTLVGRDAELQQLDAITLAALQGQTQVVHITGPAGIGKTELAYEATRRAVILGFTRCIVRVTRAMGQMPLGLLSRLVRDLLRLPGALGCRPESLAALKAVAAKELGALEHQQAASSPLDFHSTRELLVELLSSVAFEHPLFVLLDDIADADIESEELIRHAINYVRGHSIILLATQRAIPDLDEVDETLRTSIDLEPLSVDGAVLLAGAVASPTGRRLSRDEAKLVVAASDRTPLSIITIAREKLVTGLTSSTSRPLSSMISDQIRRLPWQSQVLLQTVAVLNGRITHSEIGRLLGLGLADQQRAITSLLDNGLLHAVGSTALACHAEVAHAAIASLRATERALLHRSVCISLDELMSASFDRERALELLALAETSGSAQLLIDMTLKWANRLSRTSHPKAILRFLENSLRVAESSSEREALLRLLLVASQEAAEWRVAAQTSKELGAIGASPRELSERLATIESSLHASLGRTGESVRAEALEIATNQSAPSEVRIQACRLALIAASERFDSECAVAAFRALEDVNINSTAAEIGRTEVRMQYHTIFGDLNIAVAEANSIYRMRTELMTSPDGLRRLLNASLTLRVEGQFAAAERCLDACRESSTIDESSPRTLDILWRRCVIAIDANQRPAALSLGEHLLMLAQKQGRLDEEWIALFRLRLEVISSGTIKDCRIAENIAEEIRGTPTRAQLYCLALVLNSRRLAADRASLQKYTELGRSCIDAYGRYTGMDFLAASTARGLMTLSQEETGRSLIRKYLQSDRRERGRIGFTFAEVTPLLDGPEE